MSDGQAANASYARWEPSDLGGRTASARAASVASVRLPTANELEEIHQSAHREGYAAGRQEAEQAVRAEVERLQMLVTSAGREWRACEERTGEQIVALALTVAQAMVRTALAVQPALIVAIVRDAVAQLPAFEQPVRVMLHPEDAALVREQLGSHPAGRDWEVLDDRAIARGDCRVTQGATDLDATLAQRWRQIAAALGSDAQWLAPSAESTR